MKKFVSKKTRAVRHGLIRILSSPVYDYALSPRPMIQYLSKTFKNRPLTGVEIGVAGGDNSKSMLNNLNMKMLYLIDPYIAYEDGITTHSKRFIAGLKYVNDTLAILPNVTFIRKKSENATKEIPDNLYFVYIDGNHSYKSVKRDIELYYPKVKVGGLIGGHDFESRFVGLCSAVLEFAKNNNLVLTGGAGKNDWWITKLER